MAPTYLEVDVPKCSAEDFDGEIVAINLDTGRYFSVRDSAAAIWHDLAGGYSVEEILSVISGDAALVEAVGNYVAELQAEGLMRPAGTPVATPEPLQATPGMTPPVLDSFGDMESLLLLDPVHEVDDNEGWPKPGL